jgi:O-antigen/teichoic acid export membrane protein
MLRSDFVRDVLVLSSGTGVAQFIGVAILPVLSRLYSPRDFGLMTLYVLITTVLALMASFSYELMIQLSRSHRAAVQLVWLILAMSVGAAIIVLVGIVPVRIQVANLLGAPELAAWLWSMPLLLIVVTSYQALCQWKMRLGQFAVISSSAIARSTVFATVAPAAAFVPLLNGTRGAGLIAAFIVSEVIKTLILVISLRVDRNFAWADCRGIVAVSRRHGLSAATMTISSGIALVYNRLPDLIVASFFGAATLGLFNIAQRMIELPSAFVSRAIGDVYRQRASALHRSQGRFDSLTLRALLTTGLIAPIPFLIVIFYAPRIFTVMLGPQWEQAGTYASILMVGELFVFVIAPIDCAPLIVGANSFIFLWHVARLFLNLCLFPLLMLGTFSFTGFLWALVAARITMVSIGGIASILSSRSGSRDWKLPRIFFWRARGRPPLVGEAVRPKERTDSDERAGRSCCAGTRK